MPAWKILAFRQQVAVLKRQVTAAASERPLPAVLDHAPPLLATLVRCPPDCQTGDRYCMASRWLSSLLALALPNTRRSAQVSQELQRLIAGIAKKIQTGALQKSMPNWKRAFSLAGWHPVFSPPAGNLHC
jgi:hypothetical protein